MREVKYLMLSFNRRLKSQVNLYHVLKVMHSEVLQK